MRRRPGNRAMSTPWRFLTLARPDRITLRFGSRATVILRPAGHAPTNRRRPPMQPFSPLAPDVPRPGSRVRWTSLHGSARGLAIAGLVQRAGAPVLVVTGDSPAAHRIETELEFYLGGGAGLLRFPDWETLPYDLFSPHQDIVSERLDTLARLPDLTSGVLVTPVTTAMGRIAPRGFVAGHRFRIDRGDRLDVDAFRRRLEDAGYACVSQVMEHGEYAVRGSLFDLFPMGADAPIRIDLLDDEIESLRTFDPDSQRSAGRVERIDLLPAREFPTSPEAVSGFRGAWRRRFEGDPSRCPIYREVTQGGWPAGIEYYLPLFFEETATLMDFLPPGAVVVLTEDVHDAARAFWADTRERYENRRHDRERPVLAPNEICIPVEELFAALAPHPRVRLRRAVEGAGEDAGAEEGKPGGGAVAFATRAPPALPIDGRAARPLGFLQDFLAAHPGRCLVVAETPGRREVLLETFGAHGLKPEIVESWSEFIAGGAGLAMTVAELEDGACIDEPAVAVITESHLFGARAAQRRRRRRGARDPEAVVRDLSELRPGTPVVHEEHGVGRYAGLEVLAVGGARGEFLRNRVRRRRQALRAGGIAAPRLPLHRDRPGSRAAAPAREPAMGARPAARGREGGRRRGGAAGSAGAAGEPAGGRVRGRVRVPCAASKRPSPSRRRRIRPARSSRSSRTCAAPRRWTASSAATWASARPRSRCGPRSSRCSPGSRSRCWSPPPCSRSSTTRRSATGSRTGR